MNTINQETQETLEKAKDIFREKYMQSINNFKKATDRIEAEEKVVEYLLTNVIYNNPDFEHTEIRLDILMTELKINSVKASQIIDDCIYIIKELVDNQVRLVKITNNGCPIIIVAKM